MSEECRKNLPIVGIIYLHLSNQKTTIMASIKFVIHGSKRTNVPIYVRLIAGRAADISVRSGMTVDPAAWSDKQEGLRQRIKSEEDKKFEARLRDLRKYLEDEVAGHNREFTKQWLEGIIYKYHHGKAQDAKTLNEFIERYISDAEAGRVQGKRGLNIGTGTAKGWRSFQRLFNEYQGIYTEKRIKELTKKKKPLRPRILVDYEDITIDFYHDYKNYLIQEGYKVNTIGRYIKVLKYFMAKSLAEKKHSNREFKETVFSTVSEETFNISLTPEEIQKLYEYDLSHDKRMETARDKFIVLCETALRVSDYDKIDVNIRTINGTPLIYLYQTKTNNQVIIPLTQRMEEILLKYNGHLPRIHENSVNEYIKSVAYNCGMAEVMRWETTKFGKRYPTSKQRWELVTCHTGRRSGATNMYRAGVPVKTIMSLTGHRTEAQLMAYIKITQEEQALEAAKHVYFTGTPLKVAK